MADNSPILIGRDNSANPGAQTLLRRDANSTSADPVFTVRTPVGGDGIHGESVVDTGVQGTSPSGTGVAGTSSSGLGVRGVSTSEERGFGVVAQGRVAGFFAGPVNVFGDLTVINGNKSFKIDHPLDPQNKYLLHNAVEAPERKNVYDGVAQLDEDGEAWVELPECLSTHNTHEKRRTVRPSGTRGDRREAPKTWRNGDGREATTFPPGQRASGCIMQII